MIQEAVEAKTQDQVTKLVNDLARERVAHEATRRELAKAQAALEATRQELAEAEDWLEVYRAND
jgi:hypothetical protein